MKNKICFVVATPATANAFLLKHFELLSQEFEIHLVANFEDNMDLKFQSSYIKEIKNIGIQRNINLVKDAKALIKLKKYFETMQFDAVHSVTPKAGLVSMLAAKWVGIKIRVHIFTGQVWHTKTGVFKYFLKSLDKLIVHCATNILVDGESQRKFLIENKVIKEQNSTVLGKGSISGVDTQRFFPDQESRVKHRNQLKFDNNDVVFMFLGRLNIDKGILDLTKAFCILNSEFPNAKLLLIGFDEENLIPKVKEICANENAIVILGPTSQPERILQAGDVFCLPSYREGFGTSVIEASLLEKPIICSDTYGLLETIIENKTGLRHEVANVQQIKLQMQKLMDLELRKSMGKNGRNYVIENFSAVSISNQWLLFYKKILKLSE